MSFKLWLENTDYIWNSTNSKWEQGISINIPTDIGVSILNLRGKPVLDITNSAPTNPRLMTALEALLKSRPDIANHTMTFDGYDLNQTVQEYLKSKRHQETMPNIVYTGTSFARWEKIKLEGLKPRKLTGSEPVHGKHMPSHEDKSYFSTMVGNIVKFAARDAASDGSTPMILAIDTSGLMGNLLDVDEDSDASHWMDSIHITGSFAYKGTVHPKYIKPHMVWDKDLKSWDLV